MLALHQDDGSKYVSLGQLSMRTILLSINRQSRNRVFESVQNDTLVTPTATIDDRS